MSSPSRCIAISFAAATAATLVIWLAGFLHRLLLAELAGAGAWMAGLFVIGRSHRQLQHRLREERWKQGQPAKWNRLTSSPLWRATLYLCIFGLASWLTGDRHQHETFFIGSLFIFVSLQVELVLPQQDRDKRLVTQLGLSRSADAP